MHLLFLRLNGRPSTSAERLLRELIALPSVNPAFVPPGNAYAGEQAMADFLAAQAARVGLPIERQEVFPERSNLLVRLEPRGVARRRVLLAPHLDTVGEPGLGPELFRPSVKQGRLFGRGACDTKGSVAAMFTALARLAASGPRPNETEILLAALVDEENAQAGSRALVAGGIRGDFAIVGEPTRLQVVTAHKGDVWLRLEAEGKAAHGARPELGRNAIHRMARIVDLIETEYAANLRRTRHPVLGHATVNVGSICGGTQPNIVPARCSIAVDRRTLPGENERSVRRELRRLLSRHQLTAKFDQARPAPCLPLETCADLPLVQQLFSAAGQTEARGADFFCDAAVLGDGGIPSVVFGPGDIAQAHTVREWVALRELERATDILERFLRSLP